MLTGRIYHPEDKHPPEWEKDLNPHASAGINYGTAGPQPAHTPHHTAYDVKAAHDILENFRDDILKQIPVLPTGSRLQQGATYIDLRDPNRREFTALGGEAARADQLIIPKEEVGYQIWDQIIGQTH
jgi:hypothetical protein